MQAAARTARSPTRGLAARGLVVALAVSGCDGCTEVRDESDASGSVTGSASASTTAGAGVQGGNDGAGGRGGTDGGGGGNGGAGGAAQGCTMAAPAWAARFGGTTNDDVGGIVAVEDGVVITGSFGEPIDFDGTILVPVGSPRDIFVVKFDLDGDVVWAKQFGGPSGDEATAIAATPDGRIAIGGSFEGTVDFGTGSHTAIGNFDDVFVVLLDAAGNALWSTAFGSDTIDRLYALAADPAGVITAAGEFEGSMVLPTGTLVAAGGEDIFVARIQDGLMLGAAAYGSSALDVATSVATSPDGITTMGGWAEGPIALGGDPLPVQGGADIFLAQYGPDGGHLSSKVFGGPGVDRGALVRYGSSGDLLLSGIFQGTLELGTGPMTATGLQGAFLASYGVDGNIQWATHPGGNYIGGFLAASPVDDEWMVGGTFYGTLDIAGTMVTSSEADAAVLRLDGNGNVLWGGCFGGPEDDRVVSMTTASDGSVWLLGTFGETMDVGGVPLVSVGFDDVFLVELAP
jgi:hypothetical protein